MSASFDSAIPVILKHEGGWVSDPDDAGGETNFGISTLMVQRLQRDTGKSNAEMATLLGVPEETLYKPGYMKSMKVEAAKAIYRKYFWDDLGYGQILNQNTATKAMDVAVNCGPEHCAEMMQRACCDVGRQVQVDGKAGVHTFSAINAADLAQFMQAFVKRQVEYYNGRVAARPQNAKFLKNWLKRAQWVDPTCW